MFVSNVCPQGLYGTGLVVISDYFPFWALWGQSGSHLGLSLFAMSAQVFIRQGHLSQAHSR